MATKFKYRDNKALRKDIRSKAESRSKADAAAEVFILSMLLAWFMDALRSVWNTADSKFSVKPGEMDSEFFPLLVRPGCGKSMVRFALYCARAIVNDTANDVVRYIVKNARKATSGKPWFTIGRVNPVWGRIFKKGGSEDIRIKGGKLMLMIPAGADGNDKAEYRVWQSVSDALISAIYSPTGAKDAKPKNAAESVAAVIAKGGPLLRAIGLLAGKRGKDATGLRTALEAVMSKYGQAAEADKKAGKATKAGKKERKRITAAGKAGETRKPEARINTDSEEMAESVK